jgi:uncharacterized tellurite resistance protein B-like protein
MQRLTISVHACTETLGLLVAMAWADGRLDDSEKDGVRGAAQVFNLSKESRGRIDALLEKAPDVADAKTDSLSSRDKSFAFVAAAWMAHVDGKLVPEEEKVLAKIGTKLALDGARQKQLIEAAKKLEPLPEGKRSWSTEITRLFKAIPAEIEEIDGDFEVVFE